MNKNLIYMHRMEKNLIVINSGLLKETLDKNKLDNSKDSS